MHPRTLLTLTCWVAAMYLGGLLCSALLGCQASGRASGGDTNMERIIERPTTRSARIETFGREPTPAEWSVFADLWGKKPEAKK